MEGYYRYDYTNVPKYKSVFAQSRKTQLWDAWVANGSSQGTNSKSAELLKIKSTNEGMWYILVAKRNTELFSRGTIDSKSSPVPETGDHAAFVLCFVTKDVAKQTSKSRAAWLAAGTDAKSAFYKRLITGIYWKGS